MNQIEPNHVDDDEREYLQRFELVKKAGKAAGLTIQYSNNLGDWTSGEPYTKTDKHFNPLDRDDDAFWLLLKMEIDLVFHGDAVTAHKSTKYFTSDSSDKAAAVRQAITLCAAHLGE